MRTAPTPASALLALAIAPTSLGVIIPIVNPSFEITSRALEAGEQTNGVGGAGTPVATRFPFAGGTPSWTNPVEVPGWRTSVIPAPSTAINRAGVLNPPTIAGQPFIQGHHGQHVLANQASRCGQILDHLVQPSTRYRLDFLGGIGRTDSDYFFAVSFITAPTLDTLPLESWPNTDTRRLAITSGLGHPTTARGTMLPYFLEFTTPAVLPQDVQGRYLGIHLWGSDGIPRVLYDDFRLEAITVPAPATTSLLALLIATTTRARRRRPHAARDNRNPTCP